MGEESDTDGGRDPGAQRAAMVRLGLVVGVVIVLLALLRLASCSIGGDDDEPAPTTTTVPEFSISLPSVVGWRADQADDTLRRLGLDTTLVDCGDQDRTVEARALWTVASQDPVPATGLNEGDAVELCVVHVDDPD